MAVVYALIVFGGLQRVLATLIWGLLVATVTIDRMLLTPSIDGR